MTKRIVTIGLVAILAGAIAVGTYDYVRGDSTLAFESTNSTEGKYSQSPNSGQGNSRRIDDETSSFSVGQNRDADARGQAVDREQSKAMVEEWLTVNGVVLSVDDNALTVESANDDILEVELGPTHYWSSQGIEIEPGDAVEIMGFYEDDAFVAGDITLTATGEFLMLRESNGRPLWAGGSSASRGRESQTAVETASGNSQRLMDGSSEPQPQADVEEWITVQGTITAVELNALTIKTFDGKSMIVELGPEHYWTSLGVDLKSDDDVEIKGFYEDETTFVAGEITLDTGVLTLREISGRPLWAGGSGRGGSYNGGGRQGSQGQNGS